MVPIVEPEVTLGPGGGFLQSYCLHNISILPDPSHDGLAFGSIIVGLSQIEVPPSWDSEQGIRGVGCMRSQPNSISQAGINLSNISRTAGLGMTHAVGA